MKNQFLFLLFFLVVSSFLYGNESDVIRISTNDIDLIYKQDQKGRLCQAYLGKRLNFDSDLSYLSPGKEAYITSGMEDYFEPAIRVIHNDGNPSLLLKYVSHTVTQLSPGVNETTITLSDDKYPVTVLLHYIAYQNENLIKTFTEISHREKKPLKLLKYASSMLHLNSEKYILNEFHGDWASEVKQKSVPLEFGKKILDTKLGARANMFVAPFFQLSLNDESRENSGEVIVGTLGWTGNFQFLFEVDNNHELRIVPGINPYASEYLLSPGEVFRTPDFYFTYSFTGKGEASRNFHNWARNHQVKAGKDSRMTLLNNWEATYFSFDEEKLVNLLDDAVELGVDMFLLDDGWFGSKYPRNSDRQGLGDWTEIKEKLPHGIGLLTDSAKRKGIKFGLWIEPEMVNPKSELYEKHKDWVIHLPNRDEYYFRNQMVLDLSNPKVQDYVYNVVDKLMSDYPGIAFFKWDCNSPITNIYSPYLKEKQSHLYVDFVRGLYNVLNRIQNKYPDLPMMLCSGGGGRADYEALKYFTEFWPSDNTDPVERLFIQWSYSQIFPAKTMCAHVTSWNSNTSVKFRTEVAMMCKLGFDIRLDELSAPDRGFCKMAVANYNRIKPEVLEGDLYRLVSPYESNHSVVMYTAPDKHKAVVFAYDIYPRFSEKTLPVPLQGLNPDLKYRVKELNVSKDGKSSFRFHDKVYSGDYLMKAGLPLLTANKLQSRIFELFAEK